MPGFMDEYDSDPRHRNDQDVPPIEARHLLRRQNQQDAQSKSR